MRKNLTKAISTTLATAMVVTAGGFAGVANTNGSTAKAADPTASATATAVATATPTATPTVTPTVTSTPLPVQSATEQNTLEVENGKLTGTLTVKLNSNLTEEKKVSVIAAVYDSNGKLIGIQPKEIALKPGNENQVEFKEISADSADEYTIKILTWNGNISSLAPISNTLDLSIK